MKYFVVFTFCYLVFCLINWKWIRAGIEELSAPSYSICLNCGRPWKYVEGHIVMWSKNSGTFAVCEECWRSSTLPDLKKYYTECYQDQVKQGMDDDHYNALMDSVETNYNR